MIVYQALSSYVPFHLGISWHPFSSLTLSARINDSKFVPDKTDVQTMVQDHKKVLPRHMSHSQGQQKEAELRANLVKNELIHL